MANPIKGALRHPAVTIILIAMAVVMGIHAFRNMPRMEDPSITIRTGLVFAVYPGATSEQVEQQVTKTLETHLFRYPEIRKDKTFSTSRPGLCIINVELEDNVKQADVFWSKLRQSLDLAKATELPREVMGPVINSDFGDTVALLIAIRGKRYGYRELTDYVDRIKDEIRQVREVGKLATYGGQSEQIRISASLDRLSQYFADPMDAIRALKQQNIIFPSGNVEVGASKVPMRTTGAFTAEDEIRKVMVGLSRTGQPVYIQDFAKVERLYQDPTFLVRYDGDPCVLLAVEMQKGKNIVQMGEKLTAIFQKMERTLPPDLKMDFIANQPKVVDERITGLTHEFLLAIGSVILVTLLLLPIRVALIAALAIPITMLITLGAMNGLHVELHQVSIAALIVVLGIVVDDAIVIADNYIELLDRKVPRSEAAWRCATEVVVPVTTATLTIISSFLPLLILAGSAGEFISALPITVAVALLVSFCVAIFLTPLLSHTFIKQGLHAEEGKKGGGFDMLGRLQAVYNRAIAHFMVYRKQAMLLGAVAFLLGICLLKVIPQQFFPPAERDQFVIDVWMPAGTRIAKTDQVMRRIEAHLAAEGRVTHVASFVGQSAPRFYYNVNPQQPDESYGQFIIQSKNEKATPGLVADLQKNLAQLAPEAMVLVKELQQGSQQEAPVEVRISGPDLGELRNLGDQVQGFMREASFARFIHTDTRNDSMLLDVDVNQELVNRLGLSNALVSSTLAGAFDGAPVSTFWEGDRAVAITLRLAPEERTNFGDVKDAYISSPLTRVSSPLRSMASLKPAWQNSRIVHRNGVRTLTVRAFTEHGHYGSELLGAIMPKVKGLQVPSGYRIDYGGEIANQNETFPQMVVALCISLVGIFLILLIQFRTISDPLVVMSSIPLALFGAMAGLLITGNPFGLTAFIGLISLCGIVVRNGIILVDYIKEKVAEGHSLETAAMEAGERRLRPIFLTTMAAAVGVTPMILSRSAMWSPLASVIAVGLICSMFFTLLVVPVLYVMVESRVEQRHKTATTATLALLITFLALPLRAQNSPASYREKLTVDEAIHLALTNSSPVKISKAAVIENQAKVTSATGDYFPQLSTDALYLVLNKPEGITFPTGSLGTIPGLGPFPSQPMNINQGSNHLTLVNVTLAQPLTQLFKIRQGDRVASSDERASGAELKKTEATVALGVRQLYYGILVAGKLKLASQSAVDASELALRDSEKALQAGNVLDVSVTGAKAAWLQSRQSLLSAENQIADLTGDLVDLLGLPTGTELDLEDADEAVLTPHRDELLKSAQAQNPELLVARETLAKAQAAHSAANLDYIPNIGAFARYTQQNGVPFIGDHAFSYGLQASWTIFDWGKRRGVVGQRSAQVLQAEENLRRLENKVALEVEKGFRKVSQSRLTEEMAAEALALRTESDRLAENQLKAGVISPAKRAEATAAARKAEADHLQAKLGLRLALADLERLAGKVGR